MRVLRKWVVSLDSSLAGHAAGLISSERWEKYVSDRDAIQHGTDILKSVILSPQVCERLFALYDFLMKIIALGEARHFGNQGWCHEEAGIYQLCPVLF